MMWSIVDRFGKHMKSRLHANRSKGGWKGYSTRYLVTRLKEEVTELENALDATPRYKDHITKEAADVANFAMMIADNEGILPLGRTPTCVVKDARIKGLEEALLEHRADLHEYSTRPCPTCRKSAEVLGIVGKVPNTCSRANTDRAALAAYREKETALKEGR